MVLEANAPNTEGAEKTGVFKMALARARLGVQVEFIATPRTPVLLYDGECGLCQCLVRLMLRIDRRGVLCFAPLQGSTAQAFLRRHGLNTADFDSLVFAVDLAQPDAGFYQRSAGVLAALGELGGCGRLLARLLAVMPMGWLDAIYRLVARLRYRLFGHSRPKPLPNPAWARRILD
jgi:predicted DCC family thiol-disulfide oxidoreductase YuxK